MNLKQRHTPETIQVLPLDMERINKDIDQSFHKGKKHPANITYHTHGSLALIRQPRLCIIDDEFVGHDLLNKVIFYVYEDEKLANDRHTFSCLPTYEVSMLLEELETYLKPSISLAEFSKERRGYNSRIRANESEWIRYLNKSKDGS